MYTHLLNPRVCSSHLLCLSLFYSTHLNLLFAGNPHPPSCAPFKCVLLPYAKGINGDATSSCPSRRIDSCVQCMRVGYEWSAVCIFIHANTHTNVCIYVYVYIYIYVCI